MTKPAKQGNQENPSRPKPPRGRPPKRVVKIDDDTPRNVARAFFGIRSTKYTRPKQ